MVVLQFSMCFPVGSILPFLCSTHTSTSCILYNLVLGTCRYWEMYLAGMVFFRLAVIFSFEYVDGSLGAMSSLLTKVLNYLPKAVNVCG